MRLLNVKTRKLEEFFDEFIPRYAILSHTWGADEVLYSHVQEGGYKGGSAKVDGCCAQAAKDGLDYVWIDTCCIDKSSSAELSEAINSMFAWYRGSVVCYVYLVDLTSAFAKSRWFTRGWTLQELLAPDNVVFFSASWSPIGRKLSKPRIRVLTTITGIPDSCLSASSKAFGEASVAQKMSWAAGRKTTRREDRAYSLLGIFGVNMAMLYGEGDNAFVRLQEEILRLSDDHSLLAW
ncbi:HET-domain-containing protein, partial [Coniochaeta sp. PMI_546]